MDRQIGRLLDGLKARGLEENTIVIFASDNGALPTFDGARSAPYRGHKLALYEGGIRMPFIVRWPGNVPAGKVDDRSVLMAQDLFPTLCAIAGAPLPREHALDGIDVSRAWRGRPLAKRGPMFWEYGRNDEFFQFGPDRSPNLAVRRGQLEAARERGRFAYGALRSRDRRAGSEEPGGAETGRGEGADDARHGLARDMANAQIIEP